MGQEVLFYVYLAILASICLVGIWKYGILDKGTKIVFVVICSCICCEGYSFVVGKENDDRLPVYHLYSLVEIILLTLYFFTTIKLKKPVLFALLVVVYVAVAVVNVLYFQPLRSLNSNYITFNCLMAIPMSLYSLYKILIDDSIEKVQYHVHFWFWTSFLIYYSSSFFFWQFVGYFYRTNRQFYRLSLYMHSVLNIMTYSGIFLTMLLYPQKKAHEHG